MSSLDNNRTSGLPGKTISDNESVGSVSDRSLLRGSLNSTFSISHRQTTMSKTNNVVENVPGGDSVAIDVIKSTEENSDAKNTSSSGLSRFKKVTKKVKMLVPLTKRPTPPPRLDRTSPSAAYALKGLEFIAKTNGGGSGWKAVEMKFEQLTVTTNGLLPRNLFWKCLGMNKESEGFAGRLFNALARRQNITGDSINKAQLKEFWVLMADQDFDSKLQTFFYMLDKDADGRITEAEVREIITLSASANKLSNIQKQADEYAALIMEEFDPTNLGYIMVESLEMLLLQAPSQVEKGDTKILSQMPSKKFKATNQNNASKKWCHLKYFIQDNWKRAWVLALWISAMAVLFTWKYVQYRNKKDIYGVMGYCVCMAKGAAETLKLNMALILLPVCRNTITWLRTKKKIGAVIPFDDNLNFHQIIAVGIAFGVGIHAIYHLSCDYPRLLHASEEKFEPMRKYFEQPPNYWWFLRDWEGVTGIIMVVLMTLVFILATPWLRRGEQNLPKLLKNLPKCLKKLTGFNAFWYSHHLFIIVYACLIIHGIKLYLTKEWYKKTTWMYLAVPITLYGCERLLRTFRSRINNVKIRKVVVHPEKVLALYMSKPKNFKYNSGQYMFVKCVAVSPFEWHPFSITSSPGDDYLSVHIQTSGDWTRKLANVFLKVCQPTPYGESGMLTSECIQGSNHKCPRVIVDGPYGAPAQDYKKYDVVLLVGLGIGATPMISIVKDIINNMKEREDEEGKSLEDGLSKPVGSPLETLTCPDILKSKRKSKKTMFKTKKAYLYWVTREQGSFDWFREVMNDVAELDNKGAIEMHNYCTSVYEEGDARCALIEMIQSIKHAKNGIDVLSGTRVKSHFAKPKWPEVYERIAHNHPNSTVGVFYCGRPALIKELQQLASDFSHDTSTEFVFHKENF